MATAFICVAAQHATNANAYYERFRFEPLRSGNLMPISNRFTVSPPSFAGLLRMIIDQSATEVLIVGHGTTEGLTMPLLAGHAAQASTVGIGTLMQADRSDSDKARDLHLSESQVQNLTELLSQVRNLGLTRVELRACNFGYAPAAALSPLVRALNAQIAGAPACYDTYATLNPGAPSTDATVWQQWSTGHADPRYTRFFNNGQATTSLPLQSGHRVGVCVVRCGNGVSASMMADSWDAVRQWVAAMFPTPTPAYQQGPLPAHFFFTPARPPFPLEAEYRNAINEVTLQAALAPRPRPTGGLLENLDI
jgi:hypothetical protein